MKTQTIKVEVPEGCMVKYDAANQTVKFVPEDYTVIKDFETACRVLRIGSSGPLTIFGNRQLRAMYQMQIVLKAVNRGHTFNLASGQIWYPYVRFVDKDIVDQRISCRESKVLDFDCEGRTFTLLGGSIGHSVEDGLGCFASFTSMGYADAGIGLFACHNEQIARHVSKYFARLIFDCCFAGQLGFSLSEGQRVTTVYPIND